MKYGEFGKPIDKFTKEEILLMPLNEKTTFFDWMLLWITSGIILLISFSATGFITINF